MRETVIVDVGEWIGARELAAASLRGTDILADFREWRSHAARIYAGEDGREDGAEEG